MDHQIKEDNFSERRIFSVLGVLPEPGGYGIAKFSRSSEPYQKWVMDLSQEGAERFYEMFYFDYGHSSIADLAHITVIFENISMVAAEELWDEPLIDGQASSTRYQDFERRGYHTPNELTGTDFEPLYKEACNKLLGEYKALLEIVHKHLLEKHAHERPADMDDGKYARTLKARAFDVVRFVLPMSIRTGLGHILSARTAERRLVALLSHSLDEVRDIAVDLKNTLINEPAFNPMTERLKPILEQLESSDEFSDETVSEIKSIVGLDAPSTPTLIKYAEANDNIIQCRNELSKVCAELANKMGEPELGYAVELAPPHSQLSEQVASLIYPHVKHSYTQILKYIESDLDEAASLELLEIPTKYRGKFDPPSISAKSGYELIFDLSIDCGAWRDFHRHRRMIQIHKEFDAHQGYDTPETIRDAGLESRYSELMSAASQLASSIDQSHSGVGQYVLPMAFRRRSLLKMDAEQLQYLTELRTEPENHFSVREAAFVMYEAYKERYPSLAKSFRVEHPSEENFFQR